MNFIETILKNLADHPTRPALIEVRKTEQVPTTGAELTNLIQRGRGYLQRTGIRPGDRVLLYAPNSTNWVACDLAILSAGAICVPFYSRQDPKELAFMAQDAQPRLLICADDELRSALLKEWKLPSPAVTFTEFFQTEPAKNSPYRVNPKDPVTIIYTSGTSGEPKGAVLNRENIDYMLAQTISRLRLATGRDTTNDRVFHFLPVCFAGSRIMLWTQLLRGNPLMLSTDLANLVQEMGTADPNYYLNVPAVLERIRKGVGDKIVEKGGIALKLYRMGQDAYSRIASGQGRWTDRLRFALAKAIVFSKIKQKVGRSLEFLICGSAALPEDTQRWFEMIGIRVLQVYGLTETTAIVTMDKPGQVRTGYVGHPIDGCEVKITPEGELICRGPNIFVGYWNRMEATKETLRDGWLHTGDQAEISSDGNLRIIGRVKNILVPASGHNVAPEPIEQALLEACPGAEHVVLVGHGKPFLAALITGKAEAGVISAAVERINGSLPHYKRVRTFRKLDGTFTIENGLLTANQKLRRRAVEQRFSKEIQELYSAQP